MNGYPHAPAEGRTDTSADAAIAITPLTARVQRAAYLAIAETRTRGLTTDELAARLGMERTTVQPRTSELRRLGRIVDSGQRRRNRNGKRAIVWTAITESAR